MVNYANGLSNSKAQGDVGVSAAIYHYTSAGMPVSIPLGDNTRYDLVVERNGSLLRVQCKTTNYTRNGKSYQVRLATSGGNRSWSGNIKTISDDDCDLVFVWCADGTMWEIPVGEVVGKHSYTLCWKNRRFCVSGEVSHHGEAAKEPVVYRCPDCEAKTSGDGKRCKSCAGKVFQKTKIEWPDAESLRHIVKNNGYSGASRILGVSDNAIRKRITKHNI